MGLKFLQLFSDMRDDHFEPLTDEELGIIIRAAMDYAFDGTLPEFPPRSVLDLTWRRMKRHIDQCADKVENLRENGSKGGAEKANRSKAKQAVAKGSKAKQTVANDGINQSQEHEHDQSQEQEEYYACEETAPATDDGVVIGIDGSDLREDIERNKVADSLILRYRLGRDDVTRESLIADLAEYGETKMREVLDTAASANKYDKISVKFWRAILNDNGSRASPKDTGVNYGQVYRSRQYTQAEHDAAYVNLDDMDEHGYLPGETGYMT